MLFLLATFVSAVDVPVGTIFITTGQNHSYTFLNNHTFNSITIDANYINFETSASNITIRIDASSPASNYISNLNESDFDWDVSSTGSLDADYNITGLAGTLGTYFDSSRTDVPTDGVFTLSLTASNKTLEINPVELFNISADDIYLVTPITDFCVGVTENEDLTFCTSTGNVVDYLLPGTYAFTYSDVPELKYQDAFNSLSNWTELEYSCGNQFDVTNPSGKLRISPRLRCSSSGNMVMYNDELYSRSAKLINISSDINFSAFNAPGGAAIHQVGLFATNDNAKNLADVGGVRIANEGSGTGGIYCENNYGGADLAISSVMPLQGLYHVNIVVDVNAGTLTCTVTLPNSTILSGITNLTYLGLRQGAYYWVGFANNEINDHDMDNFEVYADSRYGVTESGMTLPNTFSFGTKEFVYLQDIVIASTVGVSSPFWSVTDRTINVSWADNGIDKVAVIKNSTGGTLATVYNQSYATLTASGLPVGTNDFDVEINETFEGLGSFGTADDSFILSHLTEPTINSIGTVNDVLFDVNWTASTGGLGAVTYDIYFDPATKDDTFSDDFNRGSSNTVGNGWIEFGGVASTVTLAVWAGDNFVSIDRGATPGTQGMYHSFTDSKVTHVSFRIQPLDSSDGYFHLKDVGNNKVPVKVSFKKGAYPHTGVTACDIPYGVDNTGTLTIGGWRTVDVEVDWFGEKFGISLNSGAYKWYDFCESQSGMELDEIRFDFDSDAPFGTDYWIDDLIVETADGTNLLASDLSGLGYQITNLTQEADPATVFVVAKDGTFNDTDTEEITIVLDPQLSSQLCDSLVYPNEEDSPQAASVDVNFSVYAPLGFTSPTVEVNLTLGANNFASSNCDYSVVDAFNRDYNCTIDMRYFYNPGAYNLIITFEDNGKVGTASSAGVCNYGQLVASKRATPSVGFTDAAPGQSNSQSDNPVEMENTGNVELTLELTAYNVPGRTNPGVYLPASAFKVGNNLSSSVQMVHGTPVNLTMTIVPGEDAIGNIQFWLSMPANQLIQDYVTITPWEVLGLG